MTNLERILVKHLNAHYRPVCDLTNPPCVTSTLPVIDFDEVKVEFCKTLAQELKSADGLYIYSSKQRIYFIEFKNIDLHIKWHKHRKNFPSEFEKFQTEQNEKIRQKISDSIFLIISASGKYASDTNDVADILDRKKVKIHYTVVAPMSDKDFTLYNISSNLFKPIRHSLLAGVEHEALFITSDEQFSTYVSRITA